MNKTNECTVFHVIVSLIPHFFPCSFFLPSLSLSLPSPPLAVTVFHVSDSFPSQTLSGEGNHFISSFLTLFSLLSFSVSFFLCSLHRALSGVICVGSKCLDNRLYRIMRERVGGGQTEHEKGKRGRRERAVQCQTERERKIERQKEVQKGKKQEEKQ